MILYDENRCGNQAEAAAIGVFGEQPTPAHYFCKQNDLNVILEQIMCGNIPCNTKQPYPVIWKGDREMLQRQQQNNPPFEPPYRKINGLENIL